MTGEEILLVKKEQQVATLTLNRPKAMNALSVDLVGKLKDVVEDIRFATDIRVVIITGSGQKSFCTGADLKEREKMSDREVKRFIYGLRDLFLALENLNKPVIAAVNGFALGGGMELALSCDIRIAADTVRMGLTETRLAIIPGGGGTQRLPRLIGTGRAKELIFTGRQIDAKEALEIGLVNQKVTPEELLGACNKIAAQILETGPVAIEQAKYAINKGMQTDLNTGLAIESNAYWLTIPTRDRREGLAAFKEKRKPVYKGN